MSRVLTDFDPAVTTRATPCAYPPPQGSPTSRLAPPRSGPQEGGWLIGSEPPVVGRALRRAQTRPRWALRSLPCSASLGTVGGRVVRFLTGLQVCPGGRDRRRAQTRPRSVLRNSS